MDSGIKKSQFLSMHFLLVVLGIIILFSVLRPGAEGQVSAPQVQAEVRGTVRHVVDGDSLYINGYDPQIRLWGVDAPERDERGFFEATSTLKQLALNQSVICNRVDIDRYERTVARCFRQDGREINAEMIHSGTAAEYLKFSHGFYARRLN